ncbi:uncharacterized protein LOC141654992 [Silene latifolia]|uniref:uncharacterized protein LOC141654992 n=1 Tax=Silene latifolia TaxID=37657 RepID=UPI003D7739E0
MYVVLVCAAEADLSPSVSPDGKRIAMASFENRGGWNGEIENMKTDIYIMNIKEPFNRKKIITDGGWPTWGSDNVLFFHRKMGKFWAVFRYVISGSLIPFSRMTPDGIDAITPAAIDATKVAVVTIRPKLESSCDETTKDPQYRHIEIFDWTKIGSPVELTRGIRPDADHFNPFVIRDMDGDTRIGYHRCRSDKLDQSDDNIEKTFSKLQCPKSDIGLFRVSGAFPTFSADGSKLAFVDNEFKKVWVADNTGLNIRYEHKDSVFSTVWNQNPNKDILYVCVGPSFDSKAIVDICAIAKVSDGTLLRKELTENSNCAFPSTNPEGTKLVYRSNRDHGGDKQYKNLYIMEDAQVGEFGEGVITRLTEGDWIDTHCHWSPSGDWIVFSSTRDKPGGTPEKDNDLDPGYYAAFLVKANDKNVCVRVLTSGDDISGHINHPFFSPDGKSIVVVADLAGVSVDPISLPHFLHSVRPYGDIFVIDIDPTDIRKNKDIQAFKRMTHSRYENSTGTWTVFSTRDPNAAWNQHIKMANAATTCPYQNQNINRQVANYLAVPKRCRS